MKFDIKRSSYLQMNEKFKKIQNMKKTKHDYSLPKHSSSRGTWRVACVLVVLW